MPVTFQNIAIGSQWDRKQLAEIWGYQAFNAIARGVVTPKGDNKIILFVTEEKQESLTQYTDRLLNGVLEWEGEERHYSDHRIANAREAGDEIHIFHCKRHHGIFIYLGKGAVESVTILTDRPSEFRFRLAN